MTCSYSITSTIFIGSYSYTVVSLKIQRIFKNIISVSPNFGILDGELSSLFSRSITHHGIIGIVNITAGKLTFNITRLKK